MKRIIFTVVLVAVPVVLLTIGFYYFFTIGKEPDHNGPHEDVVYDFIDAVHDGDLAEARSYCLEAFSDEWLQSSDDIAKLFTYTVPDSGEVVTLENVKRRDIKTPILDDISAEVEVDFLIFELVKINGEWKIGWVSPWDYPGMPNI